MPTEQISLPPLCSIEKWNSAVGMSRAATYRAINTGHIRAVRMSPRCTLIDVGATLAALRSLPAPTAAQIKRAA